ncbi:MAG: GAF domain-containing sensor histidine kinase [Candidatus Aegiribacteria sp.]|nr:GAF domain-containing sensor histidine kinase [Candidatus Aegiribacteria sp.]
MSNKDNSFNFQIPDKSCALILSNNAISWISQGLSHLLDRIPVDRDAIINALSNMEDGTLPILLENQIWLSSSVSIDNERVILLKSSSKLELEEWLEVIQGGKPSILTNGSGIIYAMTESASKIFTGYEFSSLGDFLDQVSMTAFLSASSKCLSGYQVRDFSVLTRKGQNNRKSQVISLRNSDVMKELLVVSFSSPSMAMSVFEQDDSKFMRTLFSVVPIPAIKLDENGIIIAMNSHAAHFVSSVGGKDPIEMGFLDWIANEDRDRITSLYNNKTDIPVAPFQFRADISLTENITQHFEMTSLFMPDKESLLIFLVPTEKIEGSDGNVLTNQTINELMDILRDPNQDDGSARGIMEFLRVGTGARGAVYVSKSRRITVGEMALPAQEKQPKAKTAVSWTEDKLGHNVTIPVKQKHDKAYLKITGMPSRGSDPLGKLVLGLAPMMAEYIQSNQHIQGVVKLLNAIQVLMILLQGRERDVRTVLGEIGSIVGADYLAIHTISAREPVLNQLESFGITNEHSVLRIEIPSIASWAYTHTEICYVPDTAVDQRFSSVFPSSRSELAIPLVCDGKTTGTLTIGCTRRDAFGYPLGGFLQTIGTAISLWLFKDSKGIRDEADIQSKEKTGEKIHGLDDLLMSLSYRMRAPVTTLRGHTDLLVSEKLGKLTPDQRKSLNSMNIALINLVEYAERMLNFMKIELSDENLDTSWARPSDVVSSLLPVLSEKGRSQNVEVSAELPSEPFTASFDRSRLEQIIGNLVNNAIQFNKPGGSVRIEVRLDGANHWVLEVFNTGEGISSVDLPNLFDRFYTGSNFGRKTTGLGIGLTIVKSFAQQMGGTVSVRSKTGFGTWFTVRLPVS